MTRHLAVGANDASTRLNGVIKASSQILNDCGKTLLLSRLHRQEEMQQLTCKMTRDEFSDSSTSASMFEKIIIQSAGEKRLISKSLQKGDQDYFPRIYVRGSCAKSPEPYHLVLERVRGQFQCTPN